jgi:hypothetical protein
MDQRNRKGITVENVSLLECSVGQPLAEAPKNYNLRLIQFDKILDQEKSKLKYIAGFDLMSGMAVSACSFNCKFSIEYSLDDEPNNWDRLKDHVVIAHVLPFLREFVWNVTVRMPIGGVMINPLNTLLLLEEFKSRSSGSDGRLTPTP